jgi:hypothetical protein
MDFDQKHALVDADITRSINHPSRLVQKMKRDEWRNVVVVTEDLFIHCRKMRTLPKRVIQMLGRRRCLTYLSNPGLQFA